MVDAKKGSFDLYFVGDALIVIRGTLFSQWLRLRGRMRGPVVLVRASERRCRLCNFNNKHRLVKAIQEYL